MTNSFVPKTHPEPKNLSETDESYENWDRSEFIQFCLGGLYKANQATQSQSANVSDEQHPNHAFTDDQLVVLNKAIEDASVFEVMVIQCQENRNTKKFSGYAVVIGDQEIKEATPEGITPFVPGSRLSDKSSRPVGSKFTARIIDIQQRSDSQRAKIILAEVTTTNAEALADAEAASQTNVPFENNTHTGRVECESPI